ncbi:hypothetical protein GMB86_03065 [Terrilactibacillus sp. BCM23-1]|uniref:AtpZ/AtpI family protein n=2 Tax=Terrilactibacillus tamarindi TaxID=2599694 RepID=A0A6N8CQ00_9BACI|nr:hypothetical protein [Terrilactibacillus tamarindi]
MKQKQTDPWRMVGVASTIGFEIFAFILSGAWLGKRLDAHFSTNHVWLAVCLIGGLLLGLVSAVFSLITMTKD